jgi:hypothetical protein
MSLQSEEESAAASSSGGGQSSSLPPLDTLPQDIRDALPEVEGGRRDPHEGDDDDRGEQTTRQGTILTNGDHGAMEEGTEDSHSVDEALRSYRRKFYHNHCPHLVP